MIIKKCQQENKLRVAFAHCEKILINFKKQMIADIVLALLIFTGIVLTIVLVIYKIKSWENMWEDIFVGAGILVGLIIFLSIYLIFRGEILFFTAFFILFGLPIIAGMFDVVSGFRDDDRYMGFFIKSDQEYKQDNNNKNKEVN